MMGLDNNPLSKWIDKLRERYEKLFDMGFNWFCNQLKCFYGYGKTAHNISFYGFYISVQNININMLFPRF